MTIHFHPPENKAAYREKVLTIFLEALLPAAREQLGQLIQEGAVNTEQNA